MPPVRARIRSRHIQAQLGMRYTLATLSGYRASTITPHQIRSTPWLPCSCSIRQTDGTEAAEAPHVSSPGSGNAGGSSDGRPGSDRLVGFDRSSGLPCVRERELARGGELLLRRSRAGEKV